jgi:hypothetical protein
MTPIDYGRLILAAFFAVFGLAALRHGLFGKAFHFTLLGSHRPGPAMPNWFARPFFSFLGLCCLCIAFLALTGRIEL